MAQSPPQKTTIMKNLKLIAFLLLLIGLGSCNKTECEYETVCGGSSTNPKVDLVILIDGSGSMTSLASQISALADSAVQLALLDCPSDLRVEYLAMGSVWAGTKFTQTHRNYLTTLHGSGVSLAVDRDLYFEQEQGANGVEDISSLYDWRDGACKSIFYISDEYLHSGAPTAIQDLSTQAAIDSANANSVTVSANYLTYQGRPASVLANYQDLTTQTGGQLFATNANPVPANYYTSNKVFNSLVCNACNNCIIRIGNK